MNEFLLEFTRRGGEIRSVRARKMCKLWINIQTYVLREYTRNGKCKLSVLSFKNVVHSACLSTISSALSRTPSTSENGAKGETYCNMLAHRESHVGGVQKPKLKDVINDT